MVGEIEMECGIAAAAVVEEEVVVVAVVEEVVVEGLGQVAGTLQILRLEKGDLVEGWETFPLGPA